ncbi:MAG: hypothetical protein RR320_00025 [Oscillospiraceae bacterium]
MNNKGAATFSSSARGAGENRNLEDCAAAPARHRAPPRPDKPYNPTSCWEERS